MLETFKLPGSSYEELVKIIKVYATNKVGTPMPLDAIAQATGMDKTNVSRNHAFLVQLGLILEGNKKSPTQLGSDLGRAYTYNVNEQIIRIWQTAIEADEFLSRMLSAIRIRNGMDKTGFTNHILYSSGSSTNSNTRAGANTIIEIFKAAQLITEQDGKINAFDNSGDISKASPQAQITENSKNTPQNEYTSLQAKTTIIPNTLIININLNVSINDLDTLPDKLKTLIDSLRSL
jgi:hypothetical protein